MAYGVTSSGFKRKRLADIKTEIENSVRSTFGNFVNLLPSSLFAQFIGIFAEREAEIWELAEAVYFSQYVPTATGINLENALSLTGVSKLAAQKSLQQNLHFFGDVGTVVPAGFQARVLGNPEALFTTLESVILEPGTDEVQNIAFSGTPDGGNFKLRFINEETSVIASTALALDVETALNSLEKLSGVTVTGSFAAGFVITFAGDSGKINHPLLVAVDNTLVNGITPVTTTITQSTAGVPQGIADAEASVVGPTIAPLYTLTEIVNPVAGLNRILNPNDAIVGRLQETDNEVRLRHATAQAELGRSTVEAIRARLLTVLGVTQAIVFENDTDSTNGFGLPPKSFRAYVQGGDDQDIWDTVWANKPAGIYPDGTEVGTVIDSQGLSKTVRFQRPTEVPVYLNLEITRNVALFPLNGEDQIRTAVTDFFSDLAIGESVIVYPKLISALNSISGITDIELGIGTSPAPVIGADGNITINVEEIAKIVDAATDITVTLL